MAVLTAKLSITPSFFYGTFVFQWLSWSFSPFYIVSVIFRPLLLATITGIHFDLTFCVSLSYDSFYIIWLPQHFTTESQRGNARTLQAKTVVIKNFRYIPLTFAKCLFTNRNVRKC